jgi:hypothetical protein
VYSTLLSASPMIACTVASRAARRARRTSSVKLLPRPPLQLNAEEKQSRTICKDKDGNCFSFIYSMIKP